MAQRGRPPSAKTLVDRQLGRNNNKVLPAGDTFQVPNHSGDHSAGTTGTPVNDLDLANKKYVDDNIGINVVSSDNIITNNRIVKGGGLGGRQVQETGINITSADRIHGVTSLQVDGVAPSPPDVNTTYEDNVCKGWINFNGQGTIATRDSFNVSGITDNGTGDYTITWDRDFANADYAWTGACKRGDSGTVTDGDYVHGRKVASNPTAGTLRITTNNHAGTIVDPQQVYIIAFGDQ